MSAPVVHMADALNELRWKLAFLACCAWAIADTPSHGAFPESDAWSGLALYTQEIEERVGELAERAAAPPENA